MATVLNVPRTAEHGRINRSIPGLLLFLLGAIFLTVLMVLAGMAPDYDIHGGAISDLGVVPETATVFNLSLVVVGLLNLAAGVLLFRDRRRRLPLDLFVLASAGAIGAGLVPLNAGGLHSIFALTAFVAFNLEAISCSPLVSGPLRALSVVAGVGGLAFVVLMVIGDGGDPGVFGAMGHGGAERMIVYPVMLWMLAFGGALMGESGQQSDG
jgi:hypothetical membrane protein